MPNLTVIAGPNGSGKSTLINKLVKADVHLGTYINADDIAREYGLVGEAGSKESQNRADRMRSVCLAAGEDFSFETVMSHPSKTEFMLAARESGYFLTLYFVCTSDPAINLSRVRSRAELGGHDVPADRVVARYKRTLELLPHAIKIAHRTVLFDNSNPYQSSRITLKPIAEIRQASAGQFTFNLSDDLPAWCKPAFVTLGAINRL